MRVSTQALLFKFDYDASLLYLSFVLSLRKEKLLNEVELQFTNWRV